MKSAIGGSECLGVTLEFTIARDLLFHRGYLGLGSVLGGKACSGTVEDFAHHVQFGDGAGFELGDDHAFVRLMHKKASGLEPTQCFTDGRAAQSEPLGNFGLLDAVTGLQTAVEDFAL